MRPKSSEKRGLKRCGTIFLRSLYLPSGRSSAGDLDERKGFGNSYLLRGGDMALSPREILSALQWEFLSVFFQGAPPFFLTGGTALSAFYLGHRYSEDLDLFTLE